MDRPSITIFVLIVIIGALLLIRTYLLIELGTLNYEYDRLQKEIKKVKLQNNLLHQEILTKTSYRFIFQEASKAGFIRSTDTNYLRL